MSNYIIDFNIGNSDDEQQYMSIIIIQEDLLKINKNMLKLI